MKNNGYYRMGNERHELKSVRIGEWMGTNGKVTRNEPMSTCIQGKLISFFRFYLFIYFLNKKYKLNK